MQDVGSEDVVLEMEEAAAEAPQAAALPQFNPMEMSVNTLVEHLLCEFVVVPKDGESAEASVEVSLTSAAEETVEDTLSAAAAVVQPQSVPSESTAEEAAPAADAVAEDSARVGEDVQGEPAPAAAEEPGEVAPPLAALEGDSAAAHGAAAKEPVVHSEETDTHEGPATHTTLLDKRPDDIDAEAATNVLLAAVQEETRDGTKEEESDAAAVEAAQEAVAERLAALMPPLESADVVLEAAPTAEREKAMEARAAELVDSFVARMDHGAALPALGSVLMRPAAREDPSSLHMSRMHPELAKRIRAHIMENLVAVQPDHADPTKVWHTLKAAPQWTFVLPDFSSLAKEVREVLERDLIQRSHLLSLQELEPPVINWAAGASPLKPLFTAGDGNCLLHAVSLGMYGVHDRDLALRFAVHATLTSPSTGPLFKARWLEQARKIDRGAGVAADATLEKEWAALVAEASPTAKVSAVTGQRRYEYLGQFHIFVLAHVLRRPIIVYADPFVRDADTKEVVYELPELERIDGIYLPLLWPREASRADPLALCFHAAHFTPLVATCPNTNVSVQGSIVMGGGEEEADTFSALLPLVDHAKTLLPVHYLTEEEEEHKKVAVLQTFLDIAHLPETEVLVAKQSHGDFSELSKILLRQYIRRLSKKVYDEQEEAAARLSSGPCKGGCGFTGTQGTQGYCSVCYRRVRRQQQAIARPRPSPAPASPSSVEAARSQLCKGGCGFFGVAATGGYCSQCHKTATILQSVHTSTRLRRKKKQEQQRRDQQAAGAPVPCRNTTCAFHGTPAHNYYCSVCFRRFGRPSQR